MKLSIRSIILQTAKWRSYEQECDSLTFSLLIHGKNNQAGNI